MGRYMKIFKDSDVGGAGFMIGSIPQILLAVTLFTFGFVIYQKESKKMVYESSDIKKGIGILLMLIGSGIGFGLGFGTALNFISNEL